MRKVQVITDSCSDLTPELMERYGIDYAKMNTVYEGVSSPADLAWTTEDVHRLYGIMRDGNRVTTTQVPAEEFLRIFCKYLDSECDIVYIGCSLKQSGSVNTASVVAKKLCEERPDAVIYCVDSIRACMGEGLVAIEAAKYAKESGASAKEVADYAINIRSHVRQYVTVHSLDALKRAGRVKASAAFFGNLLGVKPILIADADGEQVAFKKVKGRSNSFTEIVKLLKENMGETAGKTVYFAHADCSKEEVDQLTALVHSEIPDAELYVGYIGPIIGASIGPDAVGLFALGNEVTFRNGDK